MEKEEQIHYKLGELTSGIQAVNGKMDVFIEALREHKVEDNKLHDEHEKRMDILEGKEIRFNTKLGFYLGLIAIIAGGIGSFVMNLILGFLLKKIS